MNVDGAGNFIKEIMPIIRCDNGGVVMHKKVFFKKDTLKYVGKNVYVIRKYGKILLNQSDKK